MKAIILAAGRGSRLAPLTDDKPKCMVEYRGEPIIKKILDTFSVCGVKDIIVVDGYKKDVLRNYLEPYKVRHYANEKYATTNMVESLFCAERELNEDLIISYSDIVYTEGVFKKLALSKGEISVVVDKEWYALWSQRMEDPLSDAESLKLNDEGCVVEIGKKTSTYDDIEGQYIGLIKVSQSALTEIRKYYHSLADDVLYDGVTKENMYMTIFLQLIIDNLMPVHAVEVSGGWVEVDCESDLNVKMVGL